MNARAEMDLFWRRDGTSFPVEYSSSPITEDGAIKGVVVTFTDSTERLLKEASLTVDALSSIGNGGGSLRPGFRVPALALGQLNWDDFSQGSILLALPQASLTLGNAIIAVTASNNELFPQHRVTEKQMAVSTGLMNLLSPILGGVPMCHGAGGMAGHVRFGALTGGALVIHGGLILFLAVFLGDSLGLIFRFFPQAILGVMLLFAGLELSVAARDVGPQREDFLVMLITAAFATWNMAAAFVVGVTLFHALERNLIKV